MGQKICKLIFVLDPDDPSATATKKGHNKFYNMTELGDGSFRAEWGRVGGHTSQTLYPMSKWHSTLSSKQRKGYRDITPIKTTKDISFGGAHPEVLALLNRLQMLASAHARTLYYLNLADITPEQVQQAMGALQRAMAAEDLTVANKALLTVYSLVPRRMDNVADYLLSRLENNDAFFDRELSNLQNLANQVALQQGTETTINPLDHLGLEIEPVTDVPVGDVPRFQAAFRVQNRNTQARFDSLEGSGKLLWHGTKPHSAYPILQNGLDIAYAGWGNFGRGLYHAEDYRKAYQYTRGHLFLQQVKLGRILQCPPRTGLRSIPPGYDGVIGQFDYPEFVVYDNARTTVGYLLEL